MSKRPARKSSKKSEAKNSAADAFFRPAPKPGRKELRAKVAEAKRAALDAFLGTGEGRLTPEQAEAALVEAYAFKIKHESRVWLQPADIWKWAKDGAAREMKSLRQQADAAEHRESEARAREQRRGAQKQERAARSHAVASLSKAKAKLKAVEAGVLKGTHTFEEVEEAAWELAALEPDKIYITHEMEELLKRRKSVLHLRVRAAESRVRQLFQGIIEGKRNYKEAEEAAAHVRRLRAELEGRELDEKMLRAGVVRDIWELKKAAELRRKELKREENKWLYEKAETRAKMRKLGVALRKSLASASDESRGDAEDRAAARAEAAYSSAELRIEAARLKAHYAKRKHALALSAAEAAARRSLDGGGAFALVEKAFATEAQAMRELEEAERELRAAYRASEHVSSVSWKVAEPKRRRDEKARVEALKLFRLSRRIE